MQFIWYPNCSTCKKARKWLEGYGAEFETRDIKSQNPSAQELQEWHTKSGLDLKRFFNTSGMVYKSLNLKDKLPSMTLQQQYQLLASDGMLVKRPVLVLQDSVLVGFKPEEWEQALSKT